MAAIEIFTSISAYLLIDLARIVDAGLFSIIIYLFCELVRSLSVVA